MINTGLKVAWGRKDFFMIERKYLAHYLDAKFDTTYAATEYVRLGKNLEEYNEELNPERNGLILQTLLR